jgi:hypothetical protein
MAADVADERVEVCHGPESLYGDRSLPLGILGQRFLAHDVQGDHGSDT